MPGEAAQILSAANFVRDNVVWSNVETVKGHYNFSRTDSLMAEYDAAGGRASCARRARARRVRSSSKRTPYLRMRHTVYLSIHTFESIQYYNK